jgi:hypothetical protein
LPSRWSQSLKTSLQNIFCWSNVWSRVFIFSEVPFKNVVSVGGLEPKFHLRGVLETSLRNIFCLVNVWSRVSLVLGVPVRNVMSSRRLRPKFHLRDLLESRLQNIFSLVNVWSQVSIFSEVPFENVMSVGVGIEPGLSLVEGVGGSYTLTPEEGATFRLCRMIR